jgi:hypothetical protein
VQRAFVGAADTFRDITVPYLQARAWLFGGNPFQWEDLHALSAGDLPASSMRSGTHPGGAYEVLCPTNKKIYTVSNSTAGDVTFKTVAGTGISVNADIDYAQLVKP